MVIVGGIGTVHDALLAAAIRGQGFDAVALGTPDHAALVRGRALLPRGYPSSVYYLAGALVAAVAALGEHPSPLVFVTLGGHCGHYGSEYRRALAAAGYDHVSIVAPSPAMFASARHGHLPPDLAARIALALLRACIVADVVVRMGCQHRSRTRDHGRVAGLLGEGVAALVRAIETRSATRPVLAALRASLSETTAHEPTSEPLRVRITGEFFASMTDGEASYGLVRWLESRGALVEPPALTEWALYLLWQFAPSLRERGKRLRDAISRAFTRAAITAGLPRTTIDDPAELAASAAPYYASDLRGGAGHLEVGTFLATERDDRADLVVSVKAFASTPSSSISDAVIHALARTSRLAFVSVETTGDAEMQAASRLELALDMAARARAKTSRSTRPRTTTRAVISHPPDPSRSIGEVT